MKTPRNAGSSDENSLASMKNHGKSIESDHIDPLILLIGDPIGRIGRVTPLVVLQ